MGKLDGAWTYLSGAMEKAADHGVGWRRQFIDLIAQKKLGVSSIDPTNKPGGQDIKIGEDKNIQIELQKNGNWLELRKYVHKYRRYDLRFVDLSDFLIVAVNPDIPQWGTANEVYLAEEQHKPMFFICDGGLANLPRWLFDVVDLDDPVRGKRCNVFASVEAVVEELCLIDQGALPMTDEWVLIRKYLSQPLPKHNELTSLFNSKLWQSVLKAILFQRSP